MASLDLGDVIGNVIDWASRVRRVGQATQLVERSAECDRRYLVVDVLAAGKQVRVVDAIPGAVEQAIGGVDSDVDPVYASRSEDFVHKRRSNVPDVVDRGRLVRAIEGLRNHQVVAGERNHLIEFEIKHAESNIVPVFRIVVE